MCSTLVIVQSRGKHMCALCSATDHSSLPSMECSSDRAFIQKSSPLAAEGKVVSSASWFWYAYNIHFLIWFDIAHIELVFNFFGRTSSQSRLGQGTFELCIEIRVELAVFRCQQQQGAGGTGWQSHRFFYLGSPFFHSPFFHRWNGGKLENYAKCFIRCTFLPL